VYILYPKCELFTPSDFDIEVSRMHLLAQHYLANNFFMFKDIDAGIKKTNRKYKWANVYCYLGHPLMEKIPILDYYLGPITLSL